MQVGPAPAELVRQMGERLDLIPVETGNHWNVFGRRALLPGYVVKRLSGYCADNGL